MSYQDNDIYNIILYGYHNFSQSTQNINIITAKIIKYTKQYFPNLSNEEILETIKNIYIIENFQLPTYPDSEIIEMVDYYSINIENIIHNFESIFINTELDHDNINEYLEEMPTNELNHDNINEDLEEMPTNELDHDNINEDLEEIPNYELPQIINQQISNFLNKKVNVVVNKDILKKIRNRQYKFLSENIKQLNKCCPICLDDYQETIKVKVLPCHHAFHGDCITKWLTEENYKCPICRKEIGNDQDHITISN
jgi:hypothetical protein